MKLVELNPHYGETDGIRTHVIFDCPRCQQHQITVPIPPHEKAWQVIGDSFENLTLSPSIDHDSPVMNCRWHGFITDGDITTV